LFSQEAKSIKDSSQIDIPLTRGFMSFDDEFGIYINKKRLTPKERTELKINLIKLNKENGDSFTINDVPNEYLSKGKTIYEGAKGKLITVLYISTELSNHYMAREYLVSYDMSGKPVDCILLANLYLSQDAVGEGIIEGNHVRAQCKSLDEDADTFALGFDNLFEIAPDLKFVRKD